MASRNTKRGIGAFAAGAMQSARGQIAKGRERRAQGEAAATKTLTDRSNLEYEWGQRKDIAQIGAAGGSGDSVLLKVRADIAKNTLAAYTKQKALWDVMPPLQAANPDGPNVGRMYREQMMRITGKDPGEISLDDITAFASGNDQAGGGVKNPNIKPLTQQQISTLLETQDQATVDGLIEQYGRAD